MAAKKKVDHGEREVLTVAGREVVVTNPGKIFFPEKKHTKLDLVKYYGERPERYATKSTERVDLPPSDQSPLLELT